MDQFVSRVSRVLQAVARYTNPVTKSLLAGRMHGLVSPRLILVTFVGRKTGRRYTTPVSYVREGDDLLVPGGGAWWKNLSSGPVRVRLRGTWRDVDSSVVQDPEALSEILGDMMTANAAIPIFTGIRRGADGRPTRQALERERRHGFVVVRLHLLDQDALPTTGHAA